MDSRGGKLAGLFPVPDKQTSTCIADDGPEQGQALGGVITDDVQL